MPINRRFIANVTPPSFVPDLVSQQSCCLEPEIFSGYSETTNFTIIRNAFICYTQSMGN